MRPQKVSFSQTWSISLFHPFHFQTLSSWVWGNLSELQEVMKNCLKTFRLKNISFSFSIYSIYLNRLFFLIINENIYLKTKQNMFYYKIDRKFHIPLHFKHIWCLIHWLKWLKNGSLTHKTLRLQTWSSCRSSCCRWWRRRRTEDASIR